MKYVCMGGTSYSSGSDDLKHGFGSVLGVYTLSDVMVKDLRVRWEPSRICQISHFGVNWAKHGSSWNLYLLSLYDCVQSLKTKGLTLF